MHCQWSWMWNPSEKTEIRIWLKPKMNLEIETKRNSVTHGLCRLVNQHHLMKSIWQKYLTEQYIAFKMSMQSNERKWGYENFVEMCVTWCDCQAIDDDLENWIQRIYRGFGCIRFKILIRFTIQKPFHNSYLSIQMVWTVL